MQECKTIFLGRETTSQMIEINYKDFGFREEMVFLIPVLIH